MIYTGATHCKGPNFACRAGGVKYLSEDGTYNVKRKGIFCHYYDSCKHMSCMLP